MEIKFKPTVVAVIGTRYTEFSRELGRINPCAGPWDTTKGVGPPGVRGLGELAYLPQG